MNKKFLLLSFALAFLCGTNSAMGMEDETTPISRVPAKVMQGNRAPGPERWKDQNERQAPPQVRKAADKLWEAVEIHGNAAFDAGWGVLKEKEEAQGCVFRTCFCLFTCGLSECIRPCLDSCMTSKVGEFDWGAFGNQGSRAIFDQRTKEMSDFLDEFKNVVNKNVVNPVAYSGDANFCTLGPWIEDGAWQLNASMIYHYVSGRHDLSLIPGSTMSFVNEHGGWNNI